MSYLSPATVADMVPLWLDLEREYANRKHKGANPQLTAFGGGLHVGGTAYQDFYNYYGRLCLFDGRAEGNEGILIRASQAAGKFVGVGRALLRAFAETDNCLSLEEADNVTRILIEDVCVGYTGSTDYRPNEFDQEVLEPSLAHMAKLIDDKDFESANELGIQLFKNQTQLFIGFTVTRGIIAQPGVDSGDPDNILDRWYV